MGFSLPRKPKQSFWDKVRDTFDANTEADYYRRAKEQAERGIAPVRQTYQQQRQQQATQRDANLLGGVTNNSRTRQLQAEASQTAGNPFATIRDVFDANTPSDRLKRLQRDQSEVSQGSVVDPRTFVDIGTGVGRFGSAVGQYGSGLVDLVSPGTGTSRVSKFFDQSGQGWDYLNRKHGRSDFLYRGTQAATEGVVTAGVGGRIASTLGKVPGVSSRAATVAGDVASDTLLGLGEGSGKGQKTTGLDVAMNTLPGATISAARFKGPEAAAQFKSRELTPTELKDRNKKVNQYNIALDKGRTTIARKLAKEIEEIDSKTKAPITRNITSLDEVGSLNPGEKKPTVKLKDTMDLERFKQPRPDLAPEEVNPRADVSKLSREQVVKQIQSDLGVSPEATNRLINKTNKTEVAATLYQNKENIRNAKNPDAYASGIINARTEAGQKALNQNAPVESKPKQLGVQEKLEMSKRLNSISEKQKVLVEGSDSWWKLQSEADNLVEQLSGKSSKSTTKPEVKTRPDNVDPVTGEVIDKPKVSFRKTAKELEARAKAETDKIAKEIDELGQNFEDITQKMTKSNRGDYKMTPAENNAKMLIENRFNQARQKMADEGFEFEGQQTDYWPQTKKGQSSLPETREDFLDFGYKHVRKNKYGFDEIDYGKSVMTDYIMRAENRKVMLRSAIEDAAEIDGRKLSSKDVSKAAKQLEDLQKKIKDGSESAKVLKNDTTTDLYKMGKAEKYEQVDNTYRPGSIVQSPLAMMEGAGVWNKGFKQFDNSAGYAGELAEIIRKEGIKGEQVFESLEVSLKNRMPNAEQSSINASMGQARKMMRNGLSPEQAFESAFKNVAKAELFKLGKTTNFTNKKMKKVINEQINGRILNDAYKKNFAQNLDTFISERINVSLRGANVVSALFETGDVANIFSKYGIQDLRKSKIGLDAIDGDMYAFSHKYGENAPRFLSDEIPQVDKMNEIWNSDMSFPKKVYESYRTAESKVLFFKYIEHVKTEMFFRSAEKYYKSPEGGSLKGGNLVDAVMKDYHNTMLPHKLATANRIIGKLPKSVTQYLNWSLQATKRMGRTLSGSDKGGKFADMDRTGRITRGVLTEVVPKVAAASLLGVPIMQVLGMRDFTGTTEGDFTGIDEEEKNATDFAVSTLSVSPLLGVGANFYFADRRNKIADKRAAAGETYGAERRPEDEPLNVAKKSGEMLVPFKTQANKSEQVIEAKNKGYYENRDGRIQAEGPKDTAEFLQGLVTGKNYTPTFRDYQDNPDLLKVFSGEASLGDLLTKNQTTTNIVQSFGGNSTRDYKRPLSDDIKDEEGNVALQGYSSKAKEAIAAADNKYGQGSKESKQVVQDWIKDGREYNKLYDDLRKNKPDVLNKWIETKGDEVITPEKWRMIGGNPEVFAYEKSRKLLEKKHLGREIDPIYELPEKQKNMVIQERSSYTGDDMKQRTMLYQTDWYKPFKDREESYYGTFDGKREFKSDRAKEWNALSKQAFDPTDGVIKNYPLVQQYKQIISERFPDDKYDTQERKDFTKAWYDTYGDYEAQDEAYKRARLEIVNKMRDIEGAEPLSWREFTSKLEFGDDGDFKYSSGSKKEKALPKVAQFLRASSGGQGKTAQIKGRKVSSASKKSVKSKISQPKVTVKKSKV